MLKEEKDKWNRFLSKNRINDLRDKKKTIHDSSDPRNEFQRDCDRITYSYPFRRLQDKTQVIPVPTIDFVHTRLTHSLEVATVGRSLGKMLENILIKKNIFNRNDEVGISAIVAAACLAHDIGTPPFGHSGEDSIAEFFKLGKGADILLREYENKSIEAECKKRDLQQFEGNAMGFKLLTSHDGRWLNITCATLAAFSKYPRQSYIEGDGDVGEGKQWNKGASQKKFGFFQDDIEIFKTVADEVGLKPLKEFHTGNYCWGRHSLAFLMEAADDICYRIIDIEDGFRIGKIPYSEVEVPLLEIVKHSNRFDQKYYDELKINEKLGFSYLRAIAIHVLILMVFKVFEDNYDNIIEFKFDKSLLDDVEPNILEPMSNIKKILKDRIYKLYDVVKIEIAGFEILSGLIEAYIESSNTIRNELDHHNSRKALKILDLLPLEYRPKNGEETYTRYLKIASYVSGMTDTYAINLFRSLKGITIH